MRRSKDRSVRFAARGGFGVFCRVGGRGTAVFRWAALGVAVSFAVPSSKAPIMVNDAPFVAEAEPAPFGPGAAGPVPARGGHAPAAVRADGGAPGGGGRGGGQHLRGVGAERAAGQRGGRLQPLGWPAASAGAHRIRGLGGLRRGRGEGQLLQVRTGGRGRPAAAAEGRSLRLRPRAPARLGGAGARPAGLRLDRPGLDGRAVAA